MFRITSLQNIFCLQQQRGRHAPDSENYPGCCVIVSTQTTTNLVKPINLFLGTAESRSSTTSMRQKQLVIHFSGYCAEFSHGGALSVLTQGSFQPLNICTDVLERSLSVLPPHVSPKEDDKAHCFVPQVAF